MRYRITLSYLGRAFSGWQIQNNSESVQGSLQKALSTLLHEDITVTGAGRTDAKVNAVNYVAHFDTSSALAAEAEDLCYKLNAILPKEIVVHEVSETYGTFHARFGATCREYTYFLHKKKDPFISDKSYLYPFDTDIERMNLACSYLHGTHDFCCFEKSGGNCRTSICTVFKAEWDTYEPGHVQLLDYPYTEGDYLMFTIAANRFLRNMVRAVVGTLLEVGRGRRDPQWVAELLSSGTRSDAGQSVPGHALFLNRVTY